MPFFLSSLSCLFPLVSLPFPNVSVNKEMDATDKIFLFSTFTNEDKKKTISSKKNEEEK